MIAQREEAWFVNVVLRGIWKVCPQLYWYLVSFDGGLHSMPKEVNKSPEDKRYRPTNVSKSFNI